MTFNNIIKFVWTVSLCVHVCVSMCLFVSVCVSMQKCSSHLRGDMRSFMLETNMSFMAWKQKARFPQISHSNV